MKTNAFLYVMKSRSGEIKLGHSVDPVRRSKDVGRSVEIAYVSPRIEQAERVERRAHRILVLTHKHVRGEWFVAPVEAARDAIDLARRQIEEVELPLAGRLTNGKERLVPIPVRLERDTVARIDAQPEAVAGVVQRAGMIRNLVREALEARAKRKK